MDAVTPTMNSFAWRVYDGAKFIDAPDAAGFALAQPGQSVILNIEWSEMPSPIWPFDIQCYNQYVEPEANYSEIPTQGQLVPTSLAVGAFGNPLVSPNYVGQLLYPVGPPLVVNTNAMIAIRNLTVQAGIMWGGGFSAAESSALAAACGLAGLAASLAIILAVISYDYSYPTPNILSLLPSDTGIMNAGGWGGVHTVRFKYPEEVPHNGNYREYTTALVIEGSADTPYPVVLQMPGNPNRAATNLASTGVNIYIPQDDVLPMPEALSTPMLRGGAGSAPGGSVMGRGAFRALNDPLSGIGPGDKVYVSSAARDNMRRRKRS